MDIARLRVVFIAIATFAARPGRGAEPATSRGPASAEAPSARVLEPTGPSGAVAAVVASELPGTAEPFVLPAPLVPPAALGGGPAHRSSLGVPLLEAGLTVAGLNAYDRFVLGQEWARTDPRTFQENLGNWRFDADSFVMNNLMHPYNGSIYYGAARSMGLDLWSSFGVAFLGSAMWEIGGETGGASINDQIMTSIGGSFLGEALYRCAVLALGGGGGRPGFWREAGAFLLSPPTGVNRRLFGNRYRTFDFDEPPAAYLEAFAGVGLESAPGRKGGEPAAAGHFGLHLVHGLPGDSGWPVRHPFDHFDLQLALRAAGHGSASGALFIRGMLAGSRTAGPWSGVWGLTGIYDYAAPSAFHVSTAALGVSTTGQVGGGGEVALQGTALLGAGFGTGGAAVAPVDGAGNHRGPAAQLVLETRLLLGARAAIGAGLRQYLIAGAGDTRGLEAQGHLSLSGRLRVAGPHAVGLDWLDARRWSHRAGVPDSRQRSSVLSVSYALATDPWFGARPRRQ